VGVEALDPGAREARDYIGVQLIGDGNEASLAGPFARLAHEPPVLAPLLQQAGPRLDCARHRHGLR